MSNSLYAISSESASVLARCKEYYKKGVDLTDVHTYSHINAKQYVEIYDEGENLIPEKTAMVLSAALRSGMLEQEESNVLDDGWLQKRVEFERKYYSIVTHPEFYRNKAFGCSCMNNFGYYTMVGFKE